MEYEIEKNYLNKDTLPEYDANISNEAYLKEIEALTKELNALTKELNKLNEIEALKKELNKHNISNEAYLKEIKALKKELSKQELKFQEAELEFQEAELEFLANFWPLDSKKNINKLYKNTSLIDLSTKCTYGSSEKVEEDDKEETPEDSDIIPMDADEERPPNSIRKTTQEPQDSIKREIDACETERERLLLEEKEAKNLLRKVKNEKYYTNIEIIHEEKEEDESDAKERKQELQDNIRNKDTDDGQKDTVKEEPSDNMRNKKQEPQDNMRNKNKSNIGYNNQSLLINHVNNLDYQTKKWTGKKNRNCITEIRQRFITTKNKKEQAINLSNSHNVNINSYN